MTTKTAKPDTSLFEKVDWVEMGIKLSSIVATAYLSGYVSSMATDHRQNRRASNLSKSKDSNVLIMPDLKTA
jgi:hypothetical protein